jgi:hypothetical protein
MLSRGLGALLACLACAGCTLDLPGAGDGGDDAETPVDAGSSTVGQQCTQILTELCTQAISRCGQSGFTVTDCVNNDMSQCCETTCSSKSSNPQSTVDACKAAFDSEDCNLIATSTTPSACSSLLGM